MASSSYSNNLDNTEAELRKMVVTFRVHELQHLLGFANKNKNGKKTELLNRALDLVRNTRSVAVQQKVRELFRRRFPEQRYQSGDHVVGGDSSYMSGGAPGVSPPPYGLASGSADKMSAAAAFLNMANCFKNESSNMIIDSHPDVKLLPLPFYDIMSVIVRPTLLRCLSAQKFQENYVAFTLTAQQLQDISYNENAPLPRLEVQMRFCVMDLTSEQKDDFPAGIEVRMNDKLVQLPNPIPTNKPGVEPKRPSRPVNITPYCKSSQPQRIYIHWAADPNKNYVVGVYFVRKVTSSILLQRLKQKGLNPAQRSKQMIKSNLASDNEIATTSLRVSLHCPLGKMRMQIPCRLRQCKHLQCFDADLFLRMNEKKPTWVCPVCDRPTPFEDLTIDGYFTEVLLNACKDVSEIELFESGDWVPVDKDDSSNNDSDSDSVRNSGAASDAHFESDRVSGLGSNPVLPKSAASRLTSPSTSSSSTGCSPAGGGGRLSSQTAKSASGAAAAEVVIDLTESDDEDAATTATTSSGSGRSPAAGNSNNACSSAAASRQTRCASIAQSYCSSTSPSGSIILLDSPPSSGQRHAPSADSVDPLENFMRASSHIINNPSPPSVASATAASAGGRNFSSPPKKRFKPVSPLVTSPNGDGSPSYGNSNMMTSSNGNSSSGGGGGSLLTMSSSSPLDFSSTYNSLYRNSRNHSYSNFASYTSSSAAAAAAASSAASCGSPLMAPPSSPYGNGGGGGSMITSSSSSDLQGAFFPSYTSAAASHQQNQQPPPLHFGPHQLAAASNYFNMLYGGCPSQSGGHQMASLSQQQSSPGMYNMGMVGDNRLHVSPQSMSRHHHLQQSASTPNVGNGLNVNDYLPFLDASVQDDYQRFIKACMPDAANGLS